MHDPRSSFGLLKGRIRYDGLVRVSSGFAKKLPVVSVCAILACSGALLLIGSALTVPPPSRNIFVQNTNATETKFEYIPSPPTWKHFLNESRVVFYNLFVGDDENRIQYAVDVINHQIKLLRSSAKWHSSPLLYTHIGNPKANFDFDNNSHLLKYLPRADESATLDELHSYCQENSKAIVLYIHSKGTFHPSYANDRYRTFNMRGATSPECFDAISWDMADSNENGNGNKTSTATEFNVCGARFSAFPHFHFPGNMFVASCSYVQQLVRPSEFPQKMQEIVQKMNIKTNESEDWMLGLDRYAYEHWIGSHPGVKPCDIYPDDSYAYGYNDLPEYNVYRALLRPAPRYYDNNLINMHPFWRLEGRLFEWNHLHPGEQPSDWVWDFYNTTTPIERLGSSNGY